MFRELRDFERLAPMILPFYWSVNEMTFGKCVGHLWACYTVSVIKQHLMCTGTPRYSVLHTQNIQYHKSDTMLAHKLEQASNIYLKITCLTSLEFKGHLRSDLTDSLLLEKLSRDIGNQISLTLWIYFPIKARDLQHQSPGFFPLNTAAEASLWFGTSLWALAWFQVLGSDSPANLSLSLFPILPSHQGKPKGELSLREANRKKGGRGGTQLAACYAFYSKG